MVIEENWAISVDRFREFLVSQPDVLETDGVFFFGNCRITLEPISGTLLGKWDLPRTGLRIEGPEEELNIIHRRIFLRFLSAGG